MIRVKFDMIECDMEITGHAGAPREGEFDLVCCAASTIGQQLLYSLEEYNERHHGLERIEDRIESGLLKIHVRPKEWARVCVIRRMEYAREGMEMLEERYPEYITIEEVR